MNLFFKSIFISALFVITSSHSAFASAPASGTITAKQACEAYVSKNKLTNPDNTTLVVNQKYSIFEVNKSTNPGWFRVRIDNASPPERWVAKHCGTVKVKIGGGGSTNTGSTCHTAGLEDSYVLALSWQPAFCETHRDKPECRINDKKSYQAHNFTLHGLWPNKASCGKNYGFCGETQDSAGGFCDYPALPLFTETRQNLDQVMPSAAAGSCLQRHEWYKHGTCQTNWSMDEYFDEAVDLTRQFNESGVAYFIGRNVGNTVTEEALINKIDCALGSGAHQHLELICQGGNLVDVYIGLPAHITSGAALGDLLGQGQSQFHSNCGGKFKVDPIGFQ